MAKTIDFFAITPSLTVTNVHVHDSKLGSDHTPVHATVAGKGWSYHFVTWNVEDEMAQSVEGVMRGVATLLDGGADVLLLIEVGRAKRALRAKYGPRLQLSDDIPGADDCAVLVADHVHMSQQYTARLSRIGWITVRGGTHPGQALASAVIDGNVRASAGHMPVSVRWGPAGIPYGPPMRVAAWIYGAHKIPRFVKKHNRRPHVIGMDWNARANQKGRYSPQAIAKAAGLKIHATFAPTHA